METTTEEGQSPFLKQIDQEEKRKVNRQREKKKSIWSGLGLFGMVGWSVVVPMLLGAFLGVYLDKKHPTSFSWTLTFLIAGLFLGCGIAWNWVSEENNNIHKNEQDSND